MKLDTFILADAADIGPSGKISMLGAGITRLNVEKVPTVLPVLAVVARLRADSVEDLQDQHHVRLTITDPSGDEVLNFPSQLRAPASGPAPPEGEELYASMIAGFSPIRLGKEGVHLVEFFLDDELVRRLTLPVVVGPSDRSTSGDDAE
ncbi:MAG: hypothetical protein AB7V42_16120 [Thermoleophilia bacterium]